MVRLICMNNRSATYDSAMQSDDELVMLLPDAILAHKPARLVI